MTVHRAELASAWFKSSYSSGEGGECVEVATAADGVRVRDSKDLTGPVLTVTPEAVLKASPDRGTVI